MSDMKEKFEKILKKLRKQDATAIARSYVSNEYDQETFAEGYNVALDNLEIEIDKLKS